MPHLSDHNKGVLALVGSAVFAAAMSALVKYAQNLEIDAYKLALFRFAIGAMLLGTAALFKRIPLKFDRSGLLFLRGLFGAAGVHDRRHRQRCRDFQGGQTSKKLRLAR